MSDDPRPNDVRSSYDRVADEYTRRISDELQHKPLDRQLLDRFAEAVSPVGSACDLGCGPGHVARYLRGQGLRIIGVDISTEMVNQARGLNPAIEFVAGDMRSLPFPEGSLGGIVAFYSLIHIPSDKIPDVLVELKRVLRPGGTLLIAVHVGDQTLHLDEWWGQEVSVDFHFFRTEMMVNALTSAGFEVGEVVEREPYPDVEHPSRRAYLFAVKPV